MATRSTPVRTGPAARTAAIDIGPTAIRAVEIQSGGDDERILKRGSAPLPPGTWDDLAGHRDVLAAAIRAAVTAAGITGTQVVAGLPRRLVTLKYARLPHGDEEQIRGMVAFEAQQYVPFPIEEVVLDHQIVSDDTDELTTVMIVAARRSLVNDLLAAFDKAGLEVTHLSVSALALGELARAGMAPSAVLDVEAGEMDLAIVNAGRLLFTRAATLTGPALNDGGAQRLASEVSRSLSAYENEYRHHPVSRVLVVGTPGDVAVIESTLGGLLEVPVSRLSGSLLPSSDPEAVSYATAVGLALQAGGAGMSRVNLVPLERQERKVVARRRAQGMAGALVAAAALGVAAFFLVQSMSQQQAARKDDERANRRLTLATSSLTKSKTEYEQVSGTYTVVAQGLGRQRLMVDVVKAVSDAVPAGGSINLSQFAFERGANLAVQGTAKSETAAMDLVIALQGSGMFRDVRLNYLGETQSETIGARGTAAQQAAAANMNFLVTCKVIGADQKLTVETPRAGRRTVPAAASATASARSDR